MTTALTIGAAATLCALAAAAVRRHRHWTAALPELRTAVPWLPLSIGSRLELEAGRRGFLAPTEPVDGVTVTEHDVPDGETVFVYEPAQRVRPSAAVLWMHGGGTIMGSPESIHDVCSLMARELGIVVVSARYRLAPEHPFPAALDDCTAALRWVLASADGLGVDRHRVAVGGQSAGGGLAATLAQRATDEGLPVAFQLLVYPMLDDRTALRRNRSGRGRLVWMPRSNAWAWTAYLGHRPAQEEPRPYAAAARRQDLSDLPPVWIGVGDLDLFHDEDLEYARRLEAAGVPVQVHVQPGMPHGLDITVATPGPATQAFRRAWFDALAAGLSTGRPQGPGRRSGGSWCGSRKGRAGILVDHASKMLDHASRRYAHAMAWVRSAGLRGVRAVIEDLGGDAGSLADRAGLPTAALDDDELLVQDSAIAAMLELGARTLECPDLGLRVALRQDLAMLGPLAVALQHSPTAADALDCTSRYLFVHARSLSLQLVPDPRRTKGVIAVRYGYPEPVKVPPQSADMGLLFLHRALLHLLGGSYGLRTVELPHRPAAPTSRYEELFGARVNVEQPAALLRVPSDLPGRPIEGGDDVTRRLALAYLQAQAGAAGGRAVAGRVRAVLQQSLGTGSTSIDAVAELLAMSVRSLQRHLASEGTSFSEVLDLARRDRADQLLQHSDLPIAQIAATVGFHDATTLSQSARRWWGTTARNRRKGTSAPD